MTTDKRDNGELLPCLFCGGDVKLHTNSDRDTIEWEEVHCTACRLVMRGRAVDDAPSCRPARTAAKNELISRWNRSPPPPKDVKL